MIVTDNLSAAPPERLVNAQKLSSHEEAQERALRPKQDRKSVV